MSKIKHGSRSKIIRRILVLGTLGVILATLGSTFTDGPARLLIRSDSAQDPVRMIVLLMGDTTTMRAHSALALWREHPHARIVIMREEPEGFVAEGLAPGRDEQHIAYLTSHGVPANAIIHLKSCHTTSTFDESRCLLKYFNSSDERHPVIWIVTSWYHSSRAGWIFDQVFRDSGVRILVQSAGTNDPNRGPEKWWQREAPLLNVVEEYIKWAYWRLRYMAGRI